MTIQDICNVTGNSYQTVQCILTEELNMRKISARWTPQLLTDDHRLNRVTVSRKLLHCYHHKGANFLDHIVITDETWTDLYDLEL